MRPRVLGSRSASELQRRTRSYALTTGIMETIGRCDLAMSFGVRVAENSISLKKLKRSKNGETLLESIPRIPVVLDWLP